MFHRFVNFPSSGLYETRSPCGVFGVIVTADNELVPKGVVESF
jgi:hypothetical protein